ncbi:MAG: DUF4062 domain-containing protein, partial [Planctomycetota bacterium]
MSRIFISATSGDLRSYRQVVAQWARDAGFDVVVQDDFSVQPDHFTIVEMLREKIAPCDAVIHLAGLLYGFEPSNRPQGAQRRSYTQLEYELAREFRRPTFRFLASDNYTPDNPIDQSGGLADLQDAHRRRLTEGSEPWSAKSKTTGNELYYEFTDHQQLRDLLDQIEIVPTVNRPQNLPLVGSLFKGREEFLEQLQKVLEERPSHVAAVTGKQAIHGLGGIGKTRVAVEYAKRHAHRYTALLFLGADSPESLERNLAQLCGAMVLNLPEQHATEQATQVAAAIRWLRQHAGWFLILDNVDNQDAAEAVERLIDHLETGHIVITSRLSDWHHAVESLCLDVISSDASRALLLERTAGRRRKTDTDHQAAEALAQDLGYLPLALEQAGAFIARHRTLSIAQYHERWRAQESRVLTWHDQRSMKYPHSVATTWQTTFDELCPSARNLLNVLCWLSPDPIPVSMMQYAGNFDVGEEEQSTNAADSDASTARTIDVEAALADLSEYSLATWSDDGNTFIEIHRLVEEITRFRIPKEGTQHWVERALSMVDHFVPIKPAPDDVRSWPEIYIPAQSHIASVIQFADKQEIPTPTSRLMNQLGIFHLTRSEYHTAEPL